MRMDFEGIFLSEMSEKDKYYRISLYGESKTKQNKNKFIDTDIRWVVIRGEGDFVGWAKGERGWNCMGMDGNWACGIDHAVVYQFSSVQLLSHVWLFLTPWTLPVVHTDVQLSCCAPETYVYKN